MIIKSLEELREVDERTLKFQPLGLGGRMRPEDAARYQQEVISQPGMAPEVPQRVRDCFERLRMIYSYGVLNYEFFTVAYDQAQLALEFALRERFMEFHEGTVTFWDKDENPHDVEAVTFGHVLTAIGGHLRRRDGGWRLVLRTGDTVYFDGMLDSLIRWARGEGLLRGQRNRGLEPVLRRLRNYVAHGSGDHLLMPEDAARAGGDVAETISQLWGVPTPGGRLYPAPVRRAIHLVGWNPRGEVMAGQIASAHDNQRAEMLAASDRIEASLPGDSGSGDWTWILVRAVPHDPGLLRFDSLYEVTTYPCELLWGPGTTAEAADWFEKEQPQADEAEVLDRLFLIQYREEHLYLPRRPEIALGLEDPDQTGTWYLLRVDYPADAFAHVRQVLAGGSGCSAPGPCQQCAVTTIGTGTWDAVTALLPGEEAEEVLAQPHTVPDLRVSSTMRWPRSNRILGGGNWTLADQ